MNQKTLLDTARDSIRFVVYGKPEPAGSKSSFVPLDKTTRQPYRGPGGRVIVNTVDSNPKAKEWKKLVAAVAQDHRPGVLWEGPLQLKLTFVRPHNAGHFKKNGELSAAGLRSPYPITKPDVLKLARGVEDALTGVIWKDDSQIVDERLLKSWGPAPCVIIEVTKMEAVVEE